MARNSDNKSKKVSRITDPSTFITISNTTTVAGEQDGVLLTELEGAALGIIWKKGACSGYAVMREFATSPSYTWSASAGAVYPALRRLQEMGLISAATDNRKRSLALSAAGMIALRQWLKFRPSMGGVAGHPIRTRMFFLDALPADRDRLAFLDAAEAETQRALDEIAAYIEALPDRDSEVWGSVGSAFELKARQRWLRWMRRRLTKAV